MIKTIARSQSRTLLPVLCAIAGLTTLGLGSIGVRAGMEEEGRAYEGSLEYASCVDCGGRLDDPSSPIAPVPAARDSVTLVHHRTESHGAAGSFSPARVMVRRFDVVRFETDGGAAHNVSFTAEHNPDVSFLPASGQYLTAPGQTHEIRIDLEPGVYHFQCDAHAAMGERGVLEVLEAPAGPEAK